MLADHGDGPVSQPAHVIRYEITAKGVVDANRTAQARLLTRYRLICLAAIPVGIILAIVLDLTLGLSVAIVAALSLATTATTVVDRFMVRRSARSVIGASTELALGDDGIAYSTPLGTGTIPWSSLSEVRASETSIVWHRDRVLAAWAPTSAIGAPAAVDAVVRFSRHRIAAAGR